MRHIFSCLALALACACSKSTTDTYGAEKSPPPATSSTTRPAEPVTPPVTPPANKPVTPPADRPVTPPADKPVTPPSQMPPAGPVTTPPVATDTGTDPADIDLAARVRKALVGDSSLSTLGKNVVVVVKAGDVTLRGKVSSAEEKTRIYDLTSAVTGVNNVDNRLEVQP